MSAVPLIDLSPTQYDAMIAAVDDGSDVVTRSAAAPLGTLIAIRRKRFGTLVYRWVPVGNVKVRQVAAVKLTTAGHSAAVRERERRAVVERQREVRQLGVVCALADPFTAHARPRSREIEIPF